MTLDGGRPGCAALGEQPREVGAVHPVHRDDVLVAVEEVLAHDGQSGVGAEPEEDARLAQKLVPAAVADNRTDLERDDPVVLCVEGFDDASLAAGADRLEDVVAPAQLLRHSAGRMSVRLTAPVCIALFASRTRLRSSPARSNLS